MGELAYINGRFCAPGAATVSIDDRGFQFADSVYEVVVAYGSEPFRLGEHLARLRRSLSLIDLDIDREAIDFEAIVREGIRRAGLPETMVYLQVTRGVQPRSHVWSGDLTPTVVATFRPKPVVDPAVRAAGIGVMTVDDTRRTACEIKATALLPNVIALNRARRAGYDDVVFVGPTGGVRESSSANVFAVRGGTIVTPVRDASILHGITRGVLFECAERIGVAAEECALSVDGLAAADEVFVSSTTIDILPVTRVNDKPIGAGRPGPITEKLYATFLDGLRSGPDGGTDPRG